MLQLYENIRERRKSLGMTQDELAEKVGYSGKSMIAKIESGLVDLPQSKILALPTRWIFLPENYLVKKGPLTRTAELLQFRSWAE